MRWVADCFFDILAVLVLIALWIAAIAFLALVVSLLNALGVELAYAMS